MKRANLGTLMQTEGLRNSASRVSAHAEQIYLTPASLFHAALCFGKQFYRSDRPKRHRPSKGLTGYQLFKLHGKETEVSANAADEPQ